MRLFGRGIAYVPGGDGASTRHREFLGNVLTSDPVRFARNVAVLEAEPRTRPRRADGRLGRRALAADEEISRPGYPAASASRS